MAGATSYALTQLLPQGTDVYVALFTAPPGPLGGGTEVSASGYARVAVQDWTNGSNGDDATRENTNAIEFPAFELGSDKSIEAVGVYDAAVAGNLIIWAPLVTLDGGISPSDQLRFVAGDLIFFARA